MSFTTRKNCPICRSTNHTMERGAVGEPFYCNKCGSSMSEELIDEKWKEIEATE